MRNLNLEKANGESYPIRLRNINFWSCDSCRSSGIINDPHEGYMEWLTDDRNQYVNNSLRIVHHNQRCQYDDSTLDKSHTLNDLSLSDFLDYKGVGLMLELIKDKCIGKKDGLKMLSRLHLDYYLVRRDENLTFGL